MNRGSGILGDRLSIYVSSFDDYADIWPVFFTRFFKYWPDFPYPVNLGAVSKVYDDRRVLPLRAADHKNWSSRAVEYLNKLESPYVLMILEDSILDRPVDNAVLAKLVALMDRYDLHAIRLFPDPPPEIAMPVYPSSALRGRGSSTGPTPTPQSGGAKACLKSSARAKAFGNSRSTARSALGGNGCRQNSTRAPTGSDRPRRFGSPLVLRNSIAHLVARISALVAGIVTIPLVTLTLGTEALGLVGVYATLQAMLGLFDLGLPVAANLRLAVMIGRKASADQQAVMVRTLEMLFWALVALFIVVGFGLRGPLADSWLNVAELSRTIVDTALALMITAAAIHFPVAFYTNMLRARLSDEIAIKNIIIVDAPVYGKVGRHAVAAGGAHLLSEFRI